MERIRGTVEEIIYQNEENGYVIAVIETSEADFIYIKGYLPFLKEGESYHFDGQAKVHATYGEQFEVSACEPIMPESVEDIERYLAGGAVKGIGPSLAARIVAAYGKDTFDVIQYNPEKLLAIQGIGGKKYEEIVESFRDQTEVRRVMVYLQKYGISPAVATKIYKSFGTHTIELVGTNPYRLADEIDGIGFKQADHIAVNMGIEKASPFRIASGIKYAIGRSAMGGDVFMTRSGLLGSAKELLFVDDDAVNHEISEMLIRGDITVDGERIYLPYLYYAEVRVARKLIELYLAAEEATKSEFERFGQELSEVEESVGISLHETQREAIKHAVSRGLSIITGGPGTGKTTLIRCLIGLCEAQKKRIALAAPTGRAAKRMTEATGREAKTIHRLLEYSHSEDTKHLGFNRNADNPLTVDMLIIDEVSMVDINLMHALLEAVTPGTQVVFVGDKDQLPSVGPGAVLADVIESGVFAVTRLTEIFRQGEASMIVTNAHKINNGEFPTLNAKDKDFFFIGDNNPKKAVETIEGLCLKRLKDYYGYDPIKDIQVLSPSKNGPMGTLALNVALQAAINPPSGRKTERKFGDRTFREGDKVMQIKNNYNVKWEDQEGIKGEGVFNGDVGYIQDIDQDNRQLSVLFDDGRLVVYEFSDLDQLTLAYCCTVHKSQGSEYPVVVLSLYPTSPMLLTRNILYTAVTRAKGLVVMVGSESVLRQMVVRVGDHKRQTALKERLHTIHEALPKNLKDNLSE